MKYEIIKGSEKDFEGAPEWARLVVEHCEYKYNTWFYESDKAGGQWKQCKGQLRGIVERDGIGNWLNIIAERRPISEPVWGGEGLPPVGVECEWLDNRETYVPVKIMYSSKDAVVIRGRSQAFNEDVDIPLDPVFEPTRCKFRPIRSPEDVARDEAIEDIANVINPSSQSAKDILAPAIYDAIAAGKIRRVKLEVK